MSPHLGMMDTSLPSVFVICVIASLAILVLTLFVSGPKHSYPNGPTPLPFLGNIGPLIRLKANLDQELIRIKEKWGPICMLWYGSAPIIIISSPRAVRELLNEVGNFTSNIPTLLSHALTSSREVPSIPPGQNRTNFARSYGLGDWYPYLLVTSFDSYESCITIV